MAGVVLEVNATDEQLVAATRHGDDRAFEELYGRYQRRVTAYVLGMVKDHGRAEDITQEIFVSALRRMRATERPIAFRPWIYEIARNACIDSFRRTRRTEEVSFDADEGAIAREVGMVSSTTPDAAMHAKQQIDDLMGALGGLSDSHHDILVMRELEGLSYREIGERLGISRPSVESTLFRARKRLSEEYEELVSGERCLRVEELLAAGVESLGARDSKRLARHVAHCQPCRRTAYAAGVDTALLVRHRRREAARRVAAMFPIPAFLRWSQAVSPVAEPAAGWGKALAAAAVLAAGGAGIAAHSGTGSAPAPASAAPAPARSAPAPVGHRRVESTPALHPARATGSARTAAGTTVKVRRPRSGSGRTSGQALPKPPSATTPAAPTAPAQPAHVASPPSASSVGSGDGSGSAGSGTSTPDQAPAGAQVPIVHEAVQQAEAVVTQANGGTGATLTSTTDRLGLTG